MSNPTWLGPANALVRQPNSPKFTFGDRVKCTDTYRGPQWLAVSSMLARGTFGTGDRLGWVVNQSTVDTERGAIGVLTIEWEAGGAASIMPLPIGDCWIESQEQYPRIERNKYFAALKPFPASVAFNAFQFVTPLGTDQNPFVIELFGAPAKAGPPAVAAVPPILTDPTQLALAQALYRKLMKGMETFYLASWRYVDIIYSYILPDLNNGGIIQSPNGIGKINIADNTISWLRLADNPIPAGVNGSMWKITRTWLGGPANHANYWDPDIYD